MTITELITKLESEIDILDNILGKVKTNKEKIDNELSWAKVDSNKKRDVYYDINNKIKNLRKKYDRKADIINELIGWGFCITGIVGVVFIFAYFMMLSKPFIFKALLAGGIIASIAKLGEFAFDLIATTIELKYIKKCENTEEYKELDEQLKLADAEWTKANQNVERKEKLIRWLSNTEKDLVSRKNTKKTVLRYLGNQTMPKSTTTHKSKERIFKRVYRATNEVTED